MPDKESVFIAGGAGFIGSHFTSMLVENPSVERVTIYDNFSSGQRWHIEHLKPHLDSGKINVYEGKIENLDTLAEQMKGHQTVIHLASNPDIARAVREPTIDFDQGTALTQCVVEAMRLSGAKRILYASGSGVYGDIGMTEAAENYAPMIPISTYGASKLAGEGLIAAYSYMFNFSGIAFRFGNVVGPRQTHGIGYDFVRKLKENPKELDILGDGSQSKSYVYIDDIVKAVWTAHEKSQVRFDTFNVATGDYITVSEIAAIAIEEVLGKDAVVKLNYAGGDRGWKGDVPIIRLNTDKIRATGWQPKYLSGDAIRHSIRAMVAQK